MRQRLERLREAPDIAPDEVSASLEQTEKIIATFNALLRIAQIEAGDRREQFERTDLAQIVVNVAEVFEPAAEDEGISLDVDVPEDGLEVFGDRGMLTQLLSNLVENAIKHCPSGTAMEISCWSSPTGTTLRVVDSGPGIDAVDHERVFRRFFRGEKSRSSPGLALVKAIAEMHGASIHIYENRPGTAFEIRFPGKFG